MKMLLATDGSKGSERAAGWLAGYARKHAGCEIVVAHVVRPLAFWFVPLPGTTPIRANTAAMAQVVAKAHADGEELVNRVAAELSEDCEARGVVVEGYPPEAIAKLAESEGVDMIVMGRRGLGPVSELIMGSVTDRVLHASKVPVLVVP